MKKNLIFCILYYLKFGVFILPKGIIVIEKICFRLDLNQHRHKKFSYTPQMLLNNHFCVVN